MLGGFYKIDSIEFGVNPIMVLEKLKDKDEVGVCLH